MLGADQFIEFIFTRDRNPIKALNLFFRATICNCSSCKYNCDDHISISSVFPQFNSTSFQVFHVMLQYRTMRYFSTCCCFFFASVHNLFLFAKSVGFSSAY